MTALDLKTHLGAVLAPETADPRTTFVLVTDSREKPTARYSYDGVPTVVQCLASGDYSYKGAETRVAGERKAINDAVGCATHDNYRHQEQLRRLADLEFGFVIIEASIEDIERHRYYAPRAEPERVLDVLATLHAKFGVAYVFAGDRRRAAGWMFRLLHSHWKKSRKVAP